MTRYNPPQHPDDIYQGEKQAQHITAIVQQIGAQLRELHGPFVSLVGEIKSNNKETETKTEERSDKHLAWMKRSTKATWVFSGVSLAIAGVTLWMLSNQLDIMRVDQRAWVGVVEAAILPRQVEAGPQVKADSSIRFGAVITNSRKTPALQVKSTVGASFIPTKEKFVPVYTDPPPGTLPSQGVLFPEVHGDVSAGPMSLTQEHVDAVRNGTAIMYVFGKLEYQDIFKDLHCTRFCLRFAPDFSGASACDTYNEVTDDKCEEARSAP